MNLLPDGQGLNILGGGNDGGGMGGGLLLGLLLGRGGLLGNNEGRAADLVTQADLNSQTLGDIKASIPFNEAQVQLALAQSMASLTSQNNANTQYLSAQNTASSLSAQANTASIVHDIALVDTNVDRQSTAIQIAIKEDGQATRALITANQIADLNQRLTVAQLEASELRSNNARDRDRHGVEITMTNNQNQNQLQFQQQAQVLNTLSAGVIDALQSIRSTNQAINIGSGRQTANPENTNTNVRA